MEYFTVNETAELLDLCEDTIRKYIKRGKLKGLKIGRNIRIYKRDITIFIRKCNEK
ncbi:helix-turn-helix domain-containing protein [Clostridium estertheticum]|uniref:helix-turn-helix domain-containing protein n=1 Tax=Clostridium estertheticum TaxID=238834 RepID=UPI001C7CB85B|nr:helix-turn-helix domain-containing protein [Clostridium estertheticum]MBX4268901.1 helix-turn-helix domain-containing protein [Clostridium estertheticum]WLC78906.1 helix-turn-helix domain-containing protein [Clostridium estertheticum]